MRGPIVLMFAEAVPWMRAAPATPCPAGAVCERPLVRVPCVWRCVPGPGDTAVCKRKCPTRSPPVPS